MHGDPTYVTEAFRAGASGYVLKRANATELIQAIKAALRGQFYVSPLLAKGVLDPLIHQRTSPVDLQAELTLRQLSGKSMALHNRSAAEQLQEVAIFLESVSNSLKKSSLVFTACKVA